MNHTDANKFIACRAYSLGSPIANAGFYIEQGRYNNSFVDCEANIDGSGQGCFIIGANSDKTLLVNPYAESFNQVPNVKLEAGSVETSILNLLSVSDGSAIWDLSGGEYTAYNAGFPHKNRLQRTTCTDMNATLQRYDTEFIDTNGIVSLDTSHSIHLVSSFGGAMTARLPPANAAEAIGRTITIKKTDPSANVITLSEQGGAGPDGYAQPLTSQYSAITVVSNGSQWYILSKF